MGWENITGEEKIIPSGSGGNGGQDEIKLESGKPKKVRLLLRDGEAPYTYVEHAIEMEKIVDGKTQRDFRTVRCPRTTHNPNAECPICDGQKFRKRVRNVANVWDYDTNRVQKLNGGDGIWKPIATTRKLGVDVTGVDWAILKTGSDRNDTEYSATNLGPSAFAASDASSQLFDIEAEYRPNTADEMKAIIESIGMSWEDAITPPTLVYPSLQDALNHVMPNGTYKDQSFRQIWDTDQSNRGMINYLATRSTRITAEKAAAQVILVNLGGANIPGVPKFNTDGSVANAAEVQSKPTTTPPVSQPAAKKQAGATVSADRTNKIDEVNKVFSSKKKFIDGGFKLIMDTMKECGGGKTNIVDFTDSELDKLLAEVNKD